MLKQRNQAYLPEIKEARNIEERTEEEGDTFQQHLPLSMISTLPLSRLCPFRNQMIVPFFLKLSFGGTYEEMSSHVRLSSCFRWLGKLWKLWSYVVPSQHSRSVPPFLLAHASDPWLCV